MERAHAQRISRRAWLACSLSLASFALAFGTGNAAPGTLPSPPAASPSGATPAWSVQAPQASASAGPLLAQGIQTYQTLVQTQYNHKYTINPASGTYFWDCIGFVNWALRQSTPNAWTAFHTAMNVPTTNSGNVGLWATFLTGNPGPSWSVVPAVSQLTGGEVMIVPGEVVVGGRVVYGSTAAGIGYPGHAVIIAGPPLLLSDGSYAVFVYDSTALPGHGKWDSRNFDSRALDEPGTTRASGTGYGTMRLTVSATGAPTAVYWSASTRRPITFQGQNVVPVLARPLN
jgi:hypothetical protein